MSPTSLLLWISGGQDDMNWKLNSSSLHDVKSNSNTLINVIGLLQSGDIICILFSEHIIVVDDMGIHPVSATQKCWKQNRIINTITIVQLLYSKWRWEWELGSCFLIWINKWEIYISQVAGYLNPNSLYWR